MTKRGRSVAGIAIDDGRVFIARRKPGGALGEKWEFPGGKAEEKESDDEALKREYLEEFCVKIEVGQLLASVEFSHKDRLFVLNAYRVFHGSTDLKMTEHTEWRWIRPGEIEPGDFAPSDFSLLPAIEKHILSA